MILTKPQQQKFWREWGAAKRAFASQGYTPAQIENERHALIERAGFDSLTRVDHLKGFDALLSELAILNNPASINHQLTTINQPRTRLHYAITQLAQKFNYGAPNPHSNHPFRSSYVAAIMLDKFGHLDPDRLTLQDLEQLRNTLASRAGAKHRKEPVGTLSTASDNEPF